MFRSACNSPVQTRLKDRHQKLQSSSELHGGASTMQASSTEPVTSFVMDMALNYSRHSCPPSLSYTAAAPHIETPFCVSKAPRAVQALITMNTKPGETHFEEALQNTANEIFTSVPPLKPLASPICRILTTATTTQKSYK